jgi:hypothetical protein
MTVRVSKELHNEIEEIKNTPEVDINDPDAVLEFARSKGFVALERAIEGNPNRYLRCINHGMEVTS